MTYIGYSQVSQPETDQANEKDKLAKFQETTVLRILHEDCLILTCRGRDSC